MNIILAIDLPGELARLQLPVGVAARLQGLLDRQDANSILTEEEREEAEGLVNLAEFLTLLRLRVEQFNP